MLCRSREHIDLSLDLLKADIPKAWLARDIDPAPRA
jgi:hypothetical protein